MLFSSISVSIIVGILFLVRRYKTFLHQLVAGIPRTTKVETEAELEEFGDFGAPLPDFDIYTEEQRVYRPWSSGKFAMTMGISKLPFDDLFLLDKFYLPQQELRRQLLAEKREAVMQVLPGSEAACAETLDLIVSFLTTRYPHYFAFVAEKPGYLKNHITGLTFKVVEPYEIHPLEVGAQLVMEDLNILIQGAGEDPEQHYL
jgi:hypothetical protein